MLWARVVLFGQAAIGYGLTIPYVIRAERKVRQAETRPRPRVLLWQKLSGLLIGLGGIAALFVFAGRDGRFIVVLALCTLWPVVWAIGLMMNRHPRETAAFNDGANPKPYDKVMRRYVLVGTAVTIGLAVLGMWLTDLAFPGHDIWPR